MTSRSIRLQVAAATLGACVAWSIPAQAETMTIQAGAPTGSWYPAAVAITKAMQEANPDLSVTVAPGGTIENVKAVSYGADTDLGLAYASAWHAGLDGRYPFERAWGDSRFVMALFRVVYHGAVPADSDIQSYADLKDKRLMPGKKSWAVSTMTKEILEQYGLSFESISENGGKVEFVGYDDMQRAMADRQIDFMAAFQGYPTALWLNTHNSRPVRFLPVPEEKAKPIIEKIPGLFMSKIPAGTYPINKNEDIVTIGDVTVALAHKDYDPEVVYQFVKTTMEQKERLVESSESLEFVSSETVFTGLNDAEIHPGAMRYFEEIGIAPKK